MAIAQISVGLITRYKKQIHLVKGGQGKSRIAASIALLAAQTHLFSTIHLIYTNEVLMKKDMTAFDELWSLSNLKEHVVYHSNLDFPDAEGDLLIFDEADQYIYQ